MSKQKHATTVIIGGGLTGLALAALLEKAGHDYLLVEAQNEFGGLAKGQVEQGVWLDYGMKSIPAGECGLWAAMPVLGPPVHGTVDFTALRSVRIPDHAAA